MPILTIDDREPDEIQTYLYAKLHGQKEWEVKAARLEVGDYNAGPRLGIERKTPEDFLGSFSSGRLQQQCQELKAAHEIAVLAITGNPNDVILNRHRGFTDGAVIGMLASLTVRTGVVPFFTGQARWMEAVEALVRKADDEKGAAYFPVRPKATIEDLRVNVLTAFPEIGLEKARTILAHYGTLKAALDAHNEWEEVEGVGPKTREGVTRVLTE